MSSFECGFRCTWLSARRVVAAMRWRGGERRNLRNSLTVGLAVGLLTFAILLGGERLGLADQSWLAYGGSGLAALIVVAVRQRRK